MKVRPIVMSDYSQSIIVILIALVAAISSLCLPADGLCAHSYTPLYNDNFEYIYYDAADEQHTVYRSGFQELFNPEDPIIRCARTECATPLTYPNFVLYLSSEDLSNSSLTYDRFRFYIPPGTVDYEFNAFVPRDAEIGFVVRFREPPEEKSIYSDLEDYDDFETYNWETTPADPRDFENRDVLMRNGGGTLTILGERKFTEIQEGGWMYVRVLKFGRYAYIAKWGLLNNAVTENYLNWFKNAGFDADGNPDGGSGSIPVEDLLDRLDSNGNGKIDMKDVIHKLQEPGVGSDNPDVEKMLEILSGAN